MNDARNIRVDVARGLIMAYIVLVIHTLYWLDDSRGVLKSLFLFEMPCIFMVAGYSYSLAERAGVVVRGLGDYVRYCVSKVTRILVPYYGFAFVCVLLSLYFNHVSDGAGVWSTVLAWLNPRVFGAGHAWKSINTHLWFVLPYLLVMFLLPLVSRIKPMTLPLWAWLVLAVALIFGVSKVHAPGSLQILDMTLSYLLWAILGYALNGRIRSAKPGKDYLVAGLVGLAALLLAATQYPDMFNMHKNKFPPNWIFFLFSAVWVTALLLISRGVSDEVVKRLAGSFWLKPFIKSGYSIYLWQGLGYTLALHAAETWHWPFVIVALTAWGLSIGLGVLMSPLERVRFRLGRMTR